MYRRMMAGAIGLTALLAGTVRGDVAWPVVSGGGSVLADGSVTVIGQPVIGVVAGAIDEAEQGVVPCWFTACAGDVDGDALVDLNDLAILLTNFGAPAGAVRGDGDLDGDGDVDISDLAVLLTLFGTACA